MTEQQKQQGKTKNGQPKNRGSRADSTLCKCGHPAADHFRGTNSCRVGWGLDARGKLLRGRCRCGAFWRPLWLTVLGLPLMILL